jgi:hypothetical protein
MRTIFIFLFLFIVSSTAVIACGERDIRLVDTVDEQQTKTAKSACSKVQVQLDENEEVLVEKNRIKIDGHTAQHILEDYLLEKHDGKIVLSDDDHSDVPGHEQHHHAGGKLQDSHGTISYAFLVRGDEEFHEGKAIPLYVDAESGVVYGVGCGYGAGDVVYVPDLANYGWWWKLKAFVGRLKQ